MFFTVVVAVAFLTSVVPATSWLALDNSHHGGVTSGVISSMMVGGIGVVAGPVLLRSCTEATVCSSADDLPSLLSAFGLLWSRICQDVEVWRVAGFHGQFVCGSVRVFVQ